MRFTLVGGVGNDRSSADCTLGSRKATVMGQELAGRETLGLINISQLVCSPTTVPYSQVVKHVSMISAHLLLSAGLHVVTA